MTEIVALPLPLLDSPEYRALKWGTQRFLIDLYIVFNDVERFTIDTPHPEQYRQSEGCWLPRRITELLNAGLLLQDGTMRKGPCHAQRVFRFKYSINQLQEAA